MYPSKIENVDLISKSPRKDFVVRRVHANTPIIKDSSLDSEGDFDDYLNSGGQEQKGVEKDFTTFGQSRK